MRFKFNPSSLSIQKKWRWVKHHCTNSGLKQASFLLVKETGAGTNGGAYRMGGGASATKSSLEVERPYTLAGAAVGHETHCGPMERIDAI